MVQLDAWVSFKHVIIERPIDNKVGVKWDIIV